MKLFQIILSLSGALAVAAFCQKAEVDSTSPEPTLNGLEIADDGVRIAVLGYHDFSENERETAMRIRTSKFREQMETIQKLGFAVITMEDFIAWKDGKKSIPAKSVVITIDDGWKSVYTDAYPILRELKFPFTIYLYKDYIDGGGKALTTSMIKEMLSNGATIGSHSSSHPYPQTVKNFRKRGGEEYDKFLEVELGDSRRFLEKKFNKKITTFAYPGGYFTEEMLVKGQQVGYSHLFTVQPGKVKRNLPNNILPRYIILGNYDKIFSFATNFRDAQSGASGGSIESMVKEMEFPVTPQPGSIINSRLPNIAVDFSKAENIDPSTLKMQIAGFGEVPANYASEGKLFSWQVNRRLRNKICSVLVSWKDLEGKATQIPLEWSFQIDLGAAYLPDE